MHQHEPLARSLLTVSDERKLFSDENDIRDYLEKNKQQLKFYIFPTTSCAVCCELGGS